MMSKFILLLVLARHLSPTDVGIYGLMVVTVSNAVLLAGLQFYLHANRAISGASETEAPTIIRNQAVFYAFNYCLVAPLMLLVFVFDALPWKLAIWFYCFLVIEHISYELQRLLAALGRPICSNIIQFIRTALWVYPVTALMLWDPESRRLGVVWAWWLAGTSASVTLGVIWLRGFDWSAARRQAIDWSWIKSGTRVAITYLPGTIAALSALLIDRYVINATIGTTAVGVFTFYATIANVVITFPEAGVATVMVPRLVNAISRGDLKQYGELLHSFSRQLAASVLITGLAAVAVMHLALHFYVTQQHYRMFLPAFFILVLAACVSALSLSFHHDLYARKQDRTLSLIGFLPIIPYGAIVFLFTKSWGIVGTAVANLLLQGVTFFLKARYAARFRVNQQPAFSVSQFL